MAIGHEGSLLEAARVARGLTQEALARRCGTSQPSLSAYERGAKSPTLAVLERILRCLDFELTLNERITFHQIAVAGPGRSTALVSNRLWRLEPEQCFAPLRVALGRDHRVFDLGDRARRIAGYAWLLRYGTETQLFEHLDAALLVDAWPDLADTLPPEIRTAWWPLVGQTADQAVEDLMVADAREWGQDYRRRTATRAKKLRVFRRLAAYGLDPDQIRVLMRHW
ncbi:MAG: helix-turn-helix transcriptional regulator [Actinomycetota bacterium]|nr:helix-turn-helix transcriptional regulator [Actinomycetota bacterium]